jgi:hypothetical protein
LFFLSEGGAGEAAKPQSLEGKTGAAHLSRQGMTSDRVQVRVGGGVATSSSPFQSHSQGDEDIAAPKPFEERLLEVGVHRHAQFMEQCQ